MSSLLRLECQEKLFFLIQLLELKQRVHSYTTEFLRKPYPLINPLSPNNDQCQFTPNIIHTLSRNEVMRINKMITQEKMP